MAVKNVQPTPDEQRQEQTEVQDRMEHAKSLIGEGLIPSLDVPEDEHPSPGDEGGKVTPKQYRSKGDRDEEPEPEEPEEEPEETEEAQEKKEEEEDEELIPKSKFLKRLEREQALRRAKEAELEELKSQKAKPADPRRAKLEDMSTKELKILKRQTLQEWKLEDEVMRQSQLLDLMDEIDDVIQTAPNRFQDSQASEFNKTVNRVLSDSRNQDIDFQKHGGDIKQIASNIYVNHPELHTLKKGQSIALELAVDHFREVSEKYEGKTKEANLKRQVTNLKRKTSLDSGVVKGNMGKVNLNKLRAKAKAGDYDDKLKYVEQFIDVDKYTDFS